VTGVTDGTWRQVKESDKEIMAEMGGEGDIGYNCTLKGIEL
jgi:hypothetical protein